LSFPWFISAGVALHNTMFIPSHPISALALSFDANALSFMISKIVPAATHLSCFASFYS